MPLRNMLVILDVGGEGTIAQRPRPTVLPQHPRWRNAVWFTINIVPSQRPDILGDAVTLANIRENSVDGIYSSHTIEHVDPAQSQEMFSNWLRVLKPGGRVEIRCPDVEWAWQEYFAGRLPEALLSELMLGIRTGPYEFHRNMWWASKLVTELEQAGFVQARRIDYGFVQPYLDFWPYDGRHTQHHGYRVVDLLVEAYKPPVIEGPLTAVDAPAQAAPAAPPSLARMAVKRAIPDAVKRWRRERQRQQAIRQAHDMLQHILVEPARLPSDHA